MLEALYNRKLRRGRGVVENAFGITTRKNRSVPAEFQQNFVDVTSWFGTFDSDNF
jgi:hypothetical protein